jgi:chloramphenicol-sensitive protein RarD
LRSADLTAWVYLTIGLTFGIFSLLRKLGPLGPLTGLSLETTLLTAGAGLGAVAGAFSIDYPAQAQGEQIALLSLCGFVSVAPLWLFSIANRSLRLADLGFLQYALPATQFILAVTVYGQRISPNTLVCLTIVWIALGIIVIDTLAAARKAGTAAIAPE